MSRFDDDMDEEMRLHVALLTERNVAAGMNAAEARRAALVAFGSTDAIQERARAVRPFAWLADLARDAAYGARTLRRDAGFTIVVVLTLALGIGTCAAIFSVVDGVLLRPLLYPGSDRLVVLEETFLPRFPRLPASPGHYVDWRERSTSFESLAAVQLADGIPGREGSYNLTGRGEPLRLSAARVSANTFATLRTRPALGRDFTADDDRPGHADVVISSHGFWLRRLGGRADVIGQALDLNGRPFTIVGVMPRGFELGRAVDVFTPIALSETERNDRGGSHVYDVIGRLGPGITFDEAQREMALVARRLAEEHPQAGGDAGRDAGVRLAPMLDARVGGVRPMLLTLLGAVGLLMLIACANVANLLLARAAGRSKEMAIRAALGAGPARIVRQLLTESVLLALAGGALGAAVARVGVSALVALAPAHLPRANEIAVDARALAFTLTLALAAGVAFGLAPAFSAMRIDLHRALKEGGRGSGHQGPRQQRLRAALVVVELAVALVLLAGAGLLIRSFARLHQARPGFEPEGAVAAALVLSPGKQREGAAQAAFAEQATARLAALPGVTAAGAVEALPFSGDVINVVALRVAGRPPPEQHPTANVFSVTPGYFEAMGIPLLRGRRFDAHDSAGGAPVAVISQSAARGLFPGEDPIGERIDAVRAGPDRWREIVGVVGDVKLDRLDGDVTLQAYAPFGQAPSASVTFVLRAPGLAAAPAAAAVRAAIAAIDGDQPVAHVRPLGELVARSFARERFAMILFAVFSAAALLLAGVGVYGVTAYSVAQRTGEIGVRVALGARPRDVVALVLRGGGRLVATGIVAGLACAVPLAQVLRSMLFGVSPSDPFTFIAIAVLLAIVALVACVVPARRAARVDPMIALRAE